MGSFLSRLSNFRWVILLAFIVDWMIFLIWLISHWFGFGLKIAVWDSVLFTTILLGTSFIVSSVFLRFLPGNQRFWYAIGLSFLLSALCDWVTRQALYQVIGFNEAYMAFLAKSVPVRWSLGFLIMVSISLISVFYRQLEQQQEAIKREADTAAMVKEAELQKLQTQLQPHFLFNSLNSINAMILTKPDEARVMVEQLSDFLRTTMKRADQQWVSFEEEWRYLQLYLAIEKVRFGHRLDVKSKLEEGSHALQIPTLLLQPLVENAVKYGLYGTTGNVTIEVSAMVDENYLGIRISNPFDQDMQPSTGSGFGLQGLKRRLYLLYAQNDLLQTQQTDGIFTVTLKIPKQA
ncbi:MAG TPA: histidine kinase [Cyclobacteriaceae bacterium]|nr:histidine kinase [Cyclobacteriaceae bacterium]